MIVGLYNLPSMQIADFINIQTTSGNIDLVLHYMGSKGTKNTEFEFLTVL